MNIFYTDHNPDVAALNLCSTHITKMVLESCQILSTAHRDLDGEQAFEGLYKSTHRNHPSNIWCRESKEHYLWLYRHTIALGTLYELNSGGKVHKSIEKLSEVLAEPPANIPNKGWLRNPPACMPEEFFKASKDITEAYKKYLNSKLKEWSMRDRPIIAKWPFGKPSWVDV